MPIRETFVIETTPGIDPITFDDWLSQQSESEQQRYHAAAARNDSYRQEAIDSGRMIWVHGSSPGQYIWKDEEAWKQNKLQDAECMGFYDRFNSDTGRKLVSVIEQVDE